MNGVWVSECSWATVVSFKCIYYIYTCVRFCKAPRACLSVRKGLSTNHIIIIIIIIIIVCYIVLFFCLCAILSLCCRHSVVERVEFLLCFQTLFYTLPKLACLSDDEWMHPDLFCQIDASWKTDSDSHLLPLWNQSQTLAACEPGPWKMKATGRHKDAEEPG